MNCPQPIEIPTRNAPMLQKLPAVLALALVGAALVYGGSAETSLETACSRHAPTASACARW